MACGKCASIVPGMRSSVPRAIGSSMAALISLGLCLLLGGCELNEWARNGFKVGPNYQPPRAPVAQTWIDYQPGESQPPSNPEGLAQWWRVYNDPVLNSLISDAYQQNLPLRVAGERIAEARALRGIAVGNLFPQKQEFAGAYTFNKFSDKVARPPRAQ